MPGNVGLCLMVMFSENRATGEKKKNPTKNSQLKCHKVINTMKSIFRNRNLGLVFYCNNYVKHYRSLTALCKFDISTIFPKNNITSIYFINPRNVCYWSCANRNPYRHRNTTFFYLARVVSTDICKFGKHFHKEYLFY